MIALLLTRLRRASLPTLLLIVPLALAWMYARFVYASHATWPALGPHLLLGWIVLLFLLTTFAAIVWAAACPVTGKATFAAAACDVFLRYALLVDTAGILLLVIAISAGLLALGEILRLYLILAAWVAFWTMFTCVLRRVSAPLAVILALTLSSILFAAPVTLAPLIRAASHQHDASYDNLLAAVACATPILPALDAVKSSVHEVADWGEWPLIYRFTDLGQEIGLRARWYFPLGPYAAGALVLWAITYLVPRQRV